MFRALQTIELVVEGRRVSLKRGQPVQLSENEGTVLAASGYVERVEADTDEQPDAGSEPDSGAQRPAAA